MVAVVLCGLQCAHATLGTSIPLPDIAVPPRTELFLVLLLLPSAIFITQAGYCEEFSTQALAASCLLLAALMVWFGLGWVVIHQLLMKHNIRFVASFFRPCQAPRCSNGASDGLMLTAKRKSSHGGFLVERDFADQARSSRFGGSRMCQLDDDDELDINAGDDGGISHKPASNTVQLFAEAQGATCHGWGASVGPAITANLLPLAAQSNGVSGDLQPTQPLAEGSEMTSQQRNGYNTSVAYQEEALASDVAGVDAKHVAVR